MPAASTSRGACRRSCLAVVSAPVAETCQRAEGSRWGPAIPGSRKATRKQQVAPAHRWRRHPPAAAALAAEPRRPPLGAAPAPSAPAKQQKGRQGSNHFSTSISLRSTGPPLQAANAGSMHVPPGHPPGSTRRPLGAAPSPRGPLAQAPARCAARAARPAGAPAPRGAACWGWWAGRAGRASALQRRASPAVHGRQRSDEACGWGRARQQHWLGVARQAASCSCPPLTCAHASARMAPMRAYRCPSAAAVMNCWELRKSHASVAWPCRAGTAAWGFRSQLQDGRAECKVV